VIGKAPDVQDVGALRRLRRAVRLNIDANELRIPVPLPEPLPLAKDRGSTVLPGVHPRFVVRNEDDQIGHFAKPVPLGKRGTAVGSPAANRGKPGEITAITDDSIVCDAHGGEIEVRRVRGESGAKMNAGEFARLRGLVTVFAKS